MDGPQKIKSSSLPSLAGGFFLFLLVTFISSAPVIVEQWNKPERLALKLLSRSGTWPVIHTSTSKSAWEPSDGLTAEQVSIKPTSSGLEVILEPTEASTREAYFSREATTTGTFKLSTEVHTPEGCHNGLVFRGNAQGEYYLFLISPVSYTVEILQRQANADLPREALIPNLPIPKSIGQPRTLTVLGAGPSYFFYINNVFVDHVSDSRLNGNRTGIEVFT